MVDRHGRREAARCVRMHRMRVPDAVARSIVVTAAALAVYCGGSVSGGGSRGITGSGEVAGHALPTAEAIGFVQSQGSGPTMVSGAGVILSNQNGVCALFQS